jgi:hypothetical protein
MQETERINNSLGTENVAQEAWLAVQECLCLFVVAAILLGSQEIYVTITKKIAIFFLVA